MAERELTVPLPTAVDAGLGPEVARRLLFVSPRVSGFRLPENGAPVRAVHLTVPDDGDRDADRALVEKVRRMVASDILTQLPQRPEVVWRSARDVVARPASPVFEELLATGAAVRCGPGQVALGPGPLELFHRLDDLVRRIAVEQMGAVEYRYPALLPTSALHRSGYLGSFPQHLMFASRLHADLDSYQDFLADLPAWTPEAELAGLLLAHSRDADFCLPPTMCYHTFHQLADAPLAGGDRVVTARGSSFRHEHRYHAGLERLWDFTIREVVFLGTRQFAADCRERFLAAAVALFDELDLAGHCEVAHDPFFGDSARTGPAISSQRLLSLKYEARLAVAPDRDIAVASFNRHETRFGEAFGISGPDGEPVHTACVGFGLERLMYAVLCQHGPDPERWPEPLRGHGSARKDGNR